MDFSLFVLLSNDLICPSSCSFVNDLSKHCTVYKTDANVKTGSFDVCAKCDSLADVVKKKAAEIKVKQAAKQ